MCRGKGRNLFSVIIKKGICQNDYGLDRAISRNTFERILQRTFGRDGNWVDFYP